jgi:hypothetical protein
LDTNLYILYFLKIFPSLKAIYADRALLLSPCFFFFFFFLGGGGFNDQKDSYASLDRKFLYFLRRTFSIQKYQKKKRKKKEINKYYIKDPAEGMTRWPRLSTSVTRTVTYARRWSIEPAPSNDVGWCTRRSAHRQNI